MKFITLPEKCLKLELRKEYHNSFYINNENLTIQSVEEFLKFILNLINKNKGILKKERFFNFKKVEESWVKAYYKLIEKRESSFRSRFLGKEFLYRRILLHYILPQRDLFGIDSFLKNLLEDKDYPYIKELLNILENNKGNILFFKKNCKMINSNTIFTPLEFYKQMIIGFPFELKSYKFWIENILLYNIHNELFIV